MIDQPDLEPIRLVNGREGYRLEQPWTYEWEMDDGRHYRLVVPEGVVTDGASVPRIVWTLTGILPDGLLRAAALAHDWLYRHAGRLPPGSLFERIDPGNGWMDVGDFMRYERDHADRMFARLCREAGVSPCRRRLAYLAIRLFGYWSWVEA